MTDRPTTWKEFETIVKGIMEGKVSVPNLEEMPAEKFLGVICGWRGEGGQRGNAKIPGTQYSTATATYFLGSTQGGRFDGTGHVIWDAGWNASTGENMGYKAAKFAICKHKKTEVGHNPNHSRGWHPGHCELCGLDLSVDSGD